MFPGSKNPIASPSIWLKTLALTNLIILTFLFSSCSDDNPVKTTPVSEFDSARFNWRTEDIYYHGFAGIWAQDTANIFLLNHANHSLYKVSGGISSIFNVGDYYLNDIKGLSNSEVYLFGTGLNDNKLIIIKWNGAGFEPHISDIVVSSANANWVRGCVINSNEVWVCSQNGICKFDGINMTNYSYDDTLLIPLDLFLSYNNKVQYIGEQWVDTSYIKESLFEFQYTGFVKTYSHIADPFPNGSYVFLEQVGGYKYGVEFNEPVGLPWSVCIYNFSGDGFSQDFCFNNKIESNWHAIPKSIVGNSLQNFILLTYTDRSIFESRVGIVNWDGIKPSKELLLSPYVSPTTMILLYYLL